MCVALDVLLQKSAPIVHFDTILKDRITTRYIVKITTDKSYKWVTMMQVILKKSNEMICLPRIVQELEVRICKLEKTAGSLIKSWK